MKFAALFHRKNRMAARTASREAANVRAVTVGHGTSRHVEPVGFVYVGAVNGPESRSQSCSRQDGGSCGDRLQAAENDDYDGDGDHALSCTKTSSLSSEVHLSEAFYLDNAALAQSCSDYHQQQQQFNMIHLRLRGPPDSSLPVGCAICCDLLEVGSVITYVPSCGNYFHRDCIMEWKEKTGKDTGNKRKYRVYGPVETCCPTCAWKERADQHQLTPT